MRVCTMGRGALRGTERVLLVEDESAVRENFERSLSAGGYRVRSAASGALALEIFAERPQSFDIVVTDLVMPGGLSGLGLMDELRKKRPELCIILMSGYSAEATSRGIIDAPDTRLLQKPFKPSDLCKTIRECLDAQNEVFLGKVATDLKQRDPAANSGEN